MAQMIRSGQVADAGEHPDFSMRRVCSAVGRSNQTAEASVSFGSTVSRMKPAGETSARALTRGELAVRATVREDQLLSGFGNRCERGTAPVSLSKLR